MKAFTKSQTYHSDLYNELRSDFRDHSLHNQLVGITVIHVRTITHNSRHVSCGTNAKFTLLDFHLLFSHLCTHYYGYLPCFLLSISICQLRAPTIHLMKYVLKPICKIIVSSNFAEVCILKMWSFLNTWPYLYSPKISSQHSLVKSWTAMIACTRILAFSSLKR